MLLSQTTLEQCSLTTPKGIDVETAVLNPSFTSNSASCAIKKDAGDDPDITDGMLIYATVSFSPDACVSIDGGEGVGRVTREGLNQPVGAAAINSVPRRMILTEVTTTCKELEFEGGLSVVISIPGGAERAAKTFNPQLGIVGGLSVLGTSGIVEPMSTQAILDTINVELSVHKAAGEHELIFTPGNYGEDFLSSRPHLALRPVVKCSNFIGDALDNALLQGFTSVLIVGHIGKLIKLAGGIMNTHSKMADSRKELLALHVALAGGTQELVQKVLDCATTEEALNTIGQARLIDAVMSSVLKAADAYLQRRAGDALTAGIACFSVKQGLLGISPVGKNILKHWSA